MREFKEKRRLRRFIYSPISILILLGAFVFFAKNTWDMYQTAEEAREAEALSEGRLSELEARRRFLEDNILSLSNKEGVEKALREKYNVRLPDERMAILVEREVGAAASSSSFGSIQSWFENNFSR